MGWYSQLAEVINRNADLRRLRDEGYAIEVNGPYLIIYDIPYLDASHQVKTGTMVTDLNINNGVVNYPRMQCKHIMHFSGFQPYRANGEQLSAIMYQEYATPKVMADIQINRSFSNKPQGDYTNYYEKVVNYINILSNEAQEVSPEVTPKTYRRITREVKSVFEYEDTNTSRAGISEISDKFLQRKIAIIGIGGTGSYILDQIAKTPVDEIHLFDDDEFCQHNAFRAPGAADREAFSEIKKKTDYFKSVYSHMHKNIVSHPYRVDANTIDDLSSMDFVFISIDSGPSKRVIIDKLLQEKIPFVDCGIDVTQDGYFLNGLARATMCSNGDADVVNNFISFEEANGDLYNSNIQTADLNCLCAMMAVIEWKKLCGFYKRASITTQKTYSTSNGKML